MVHLAAMVENTKADKVDITPVGIFKRELSTAENPKPLMTSPPNVVKPVGMLIVSLTEISERMMVSYLRWEY